MLRLRLGYLGSTRGVNVYIHGSITKPALRCMWDVIVISASSQELANTACDELRAASPDVHGAKILAVADPSKEHRV